LASLRIIEQNVVVSFRLSILPKGKRCHRCPPLTASSFDTTPTTTTTASTASVSPSTKRSGADDARGAALLIQDVTIMLGGGFNSVILEDVNWRIEPNTKWALVGTNGAGKSTLLKAIVGDIPYDGTIIKGTQGKRDLAYLQQTAVAGSERTVFDEAASGMTAIQQARVEIERAQEEEDLNGLNRALARFEAAGGYQQEQRVATVLKGLGFSNADSDKPCKELSGGWQMRVALARTLLTEPSMTILDEPGNHLDAAAKKWLAQYLRDYTGGSMVLVTHDIELLQSMNNIAEIVMGTLQIFKSCSYEEYLEVKELRAQSALADFERNTKKAAKLQAFVDRFGASATRASAAQSRVKQLERMKRQGMLDSPAEALIANRFKPRLVLPQPPRAVGETLLCLKDDAQVGYNGKTLVTLNLDIIRGMKLLIRGPNGAGKSTVLHSVRGTLPLIQGVRVENPALRLGMFTQDLAQELDVNARAVDLVTAYAREGPDGDIRISDQDARNAMGRLGLQGDKPLRKVGDLSGGEKARVALAMFSLKPSNLYLLDEASNHLDVECVEALGEALSQWGSDEGAVVVVSHDRNFCEKIPFTHVATVQDGKLTMEQRSPVSTDFEIASLSLAAPTNGRGDKSTHSSRESSVKETETQIDPALRKKAFNAPKRIAKLEELLESTELRIAQLDEEMLANGNDLGRLQDLSKEKEKLVATAANYMAEWEELEQLLV